MDTPRLKMPLMKWQPFLGMVVFALAGLGYLALALRVPVLSPILSVGCLAAAALVVIIWFNPFTKRARRGDSEGSLLLSNVSAYESMTGAVRRIEVVETARRQFGIDAAAAFSGDSVQGVLTPRATRMMGREYRVAVDLIANGRVFRAGFLPVGIDRDLDAYLFPLAAEGRYVKVPVTILGTEKPFKVNVELGEIPAIQPNTR